jgi:ketopantoate reductase
MEREKLEKNIAAIRVAPNEAEVGKYTDAILIDVEQYANERVIEELEKIIYEGKELPLYIDNIGSNAKQRFRELRALKI